MIAGRVAAGPWVSCLLGLDAPCVRGAWISCIRGAWTSCIFPSLDAGDSAKDADKANTVAVTLSMCVLSFPRSGSVVAWQDARSPLAESGGRHAPADHTGRSVAVLSNDDAVVNL